MITRRLDLQAVLDRAARSEPTASAAWLDAPPRHSHTVHRSVRLPERDLQRYADGLLGWQVHRGSGLRTLAGGPAEPGRDVALGTRLGPLWLGFACRVVATVEELDRAGFTYVTYPGHPVAGAEEFLLTRDGDGVLLTLHSVSREALLPARLAPPVARWLQVRATDDMLAAATRL